MSPVRILGIGTAVGGLSSFFLAAVLVAWLAVSAGGGAGMNAFGGQCAAGDVTDEVPVELRPIFREAAAEYRLGERGPSILAGLTSIESGFGRNMGPSSAGAIGWTQFLPSTWTAYGVDADGDGTRDPFNARDAIHSAANYLRASGAPRSWHKALFTYNHADWYVRKVLAEADRLSKPGATPTCASNVTPTTPGVTQTNAPAGIVGIPGMPGEFIDQRILRDVLWLIQTFHVRVSDGYAPTGHAADGEHPLGLAVDLVPGNGGTWDDIDRLARWAEPRQGRPVPPFRWVGYDGDRNHGRGHHLHLSWNHGGPRGSGWVSVLAAP